MKNIITESLKYWWMPLVSGVLMIVLGVLVFRTPVESYMALTLLFEIGFLLSGLFQIGFVLSNKQSIHNWKWSLTGGFLDVFLAFILFFTPGLSSFMLPIYIGFMLLFRSVMGIGLSIEMEQSYIKGWGWVLAGSIISIIFSLLMILHPIFGGLSVIFYTSFSIIFLGLSLISLSINLYKTRKEIKKFDSFELEY